MSDDTTSYRSEARAVQRPMRSDPRGVPGRAAPPASGERLTRRRRTADPLYIDPRIIPPGMSYEWKRESLFGKPDGSHQIGLRENHWRAVPAERHPDLAEDGQSVIRKGDTILMERPKYLTEEAQMEDLSEAMGRVQSMEEIMYGTKPGQFERDHPEVRKRSYVRQQYAPGAPATEAGDDGLSAEP